MDYVRLETYKANNWDLSEYERKLNPNGKLFPWNSYRWKGFILSDWSIMKNDRVNFVAFPLYISNLFVSQSGMLK